MKITVSDFPAKGNQLSADEIVELARLAEQVGFDRIGITDFPFHYDCVALMSACLRATERIEVESLVTTPYARLPDMAACAWATLAVLSGNRAIMGVGGGVEAPSAVWVPPWGNERPKPIRAVREFVNICREMWAGRTPPPDGVVLRSSALPLNFTLKQPVPVLVAARGQQMMHLAGEIADIAHLAAPYLHPDYVRANVERLGSGAARAGRSLGEFEIDLTVSLCTGASRSAARERAKTTTGAAILWMAGADEYARRRTHWERPPGFRVGQDLVTALADEWDMWTGEPLPTRLARRITDDLLDDFAVAGDPGECVERLKSLAGAAPAVTGFRLKLPPLGGSNSYRDYREMIEACEEIVTAVCSW